MPRATRRKNPVNWRLTDYRDEYLRLRFQAKDFHDLQRIREADEATYDRESEDFYSFYRAEKNALPVITSLVLEAKHATSPRERKDALDMALAVLGARMNKVG